MRSNGPTGICSGSVHRSTLTCPRPARRLRAAVTARSETSTATSSSQRSASSAVKTPMDAPASRALRNLRSPNTARVLAYLSRSYSLVSKPQGSPDSA